MTVATKLAEARKLIERGWCQGHGKKGSDRYCALGACGMVAGEDYPALRAFLQKATGERFVTQWNDEEGRTQAEVIEAFKRAEQLARDGAE